MSDNSNETTEKLQIEGLLEKNKVVVKDENGIEEFYENSYIGTIEIREGEKLLLLEPIEVLLLIERNRILLWKNNNKEKELLDFEGLLTYFSKFDDRVWQKYVIYMDLRKRGYIVRAGYGDGIDFRVFKRGADFKEDTAKYLIYPVFEGSPIELKDLDKISRVALSSRKELIVATVDSQSKAIYYSVKKFEILNKEVVENTHDR